MEDNEKIVRVSDKDMEKVTGGTRTVYHTVRAHDTLESIAAGYGVPEDSLRIWNRIGPDGKLPPKVIIYL
ncbi:MAG: LysM peptidoglycan-binding domain-containing protein [Ruminiclostridium sp.]|nr:LysM peptidoglycan-binding domain-containing protein [Ruminiclostridium sp.]